MHYSSISRGRALRSGWLHQVVRRGAVTVFTVLLAASAGAALQIEPNPGPGVDTYKSDQYRVEASDGSKWIESYVYMTDNPNGSNVWPGGAVHFTSFGISGEAEVRVTRLTGDVSTVSFSPKSRGITPQFTDGKAAFRLRPLDKVWLSFDEGAKSTALLIFADPPSPAAPAEAKRYRRGVQFAGDNDSPLYTPKSGETVYLDAGAWVKGCFDMRHCRGARVMGPGVLSGELWDVTAEHNPFMIYGDRNASVMEEGKAVPAVNNYEGFTVVRAPGYNFRDVPADLVSNVKLISPWRNSTDGFQIIPHPDKPSVIENCFAFVGDDIFFVRENFSGSLEIKNCFVSSSNNSVFQMGYWGGPLNHDHTVYAHDIYIKNYLNSRYSAIFRASINGEKNTGEKNMTFENIRIEGDLLGSLLQMENREYFWPQQTKRAETKLGNTENFVFRNVSLSGRQGKPSTLLGLDENNGHHDYLLDRVSIGGVTLNAQNYGDHLQVNPYVWNLRFIGAADAPPVTINPKP